MPSFQEGLCSGTPNRCRRKPKENAQISPVAMTGFFVFGESVDLILKCAKAFEKLLDTQYSVTIAHKGNKIDFIIGFEATDFHHLVGLHKLKDLRISRAEREKVFHKILEGEISDSDIRRSRYFREIEKRLNAFANFEDILDSNQLIFRYITPPSQFSQIQAQFLLSTPYQNEEIYIFIDRKDNAENFFCRSFFPKVEKDYTIGQVKYTLLYKEKRTVSTGESVVQCERK